MKKRMSLWLLVLALPILVLAQAAPKKDKPPTRKEMEDMKKEMQKALDEMSPEDKKTLDSMGIKMGPVNIPAVSDAALAQAMEEEERIVPRKDIARIASIQKTPLTVTSIPAYLLMVHNQLAGALGASVKASGDQVYLQLNESNTSPGALGNAAVGLWMMGQPQLALWVMSKACRDDPADADNLNNFSAFLVMAGGEQLALPILEHLNKQFPGNSTVLNNIGQAWFGLGDAGKAERYLDSTIHIYAYHPQANYTKSLLEQDKDHKGEAVEAMKRSIHHRYSQQKEQKLKKLGYPLKADDLEWDRPMPADILGLETFKWPAYPKNVEESSVSEAEWNAFRAACTEAIAGLESHMKELEENMINIAQQRTREVLLAGQKGIMVDVVPRYAPKAMIKLKYLIEGKDGHLAFNYQKKGEAVASAYQQTGEFEQRLSSQLEELDKKYEDLFGEGKPNPFEAACSDENAAKNEFLSQANKLLEDASLDFLAFMRRKINDEIYYDQYTMWPEQFELAKAQACFSWLHLIKDQKVMFRPKSEKCREVKTKDTTNTSKLAQFDDTHCNYHSEMNLKIGTINSDCSQLSAKLNLEFIKLGLKTKEGDKADETFMDQFTSCSIEVGVKKGFSVGSGPIKGEAKIGAAAFVEMDRNGISDAGLIVSADIKAGTNLIKVQDGTTVVADNGVKVEVMKGTSIGPSVKDLSFTVVGAEAKISVNSGFSVEGKGILKGLSK